MTKRENIGVSLGLSKMIRGKIGSVMGLPYMWNNSRNHSDEFSYWENLILMKPRFSRGH
jgi:hypothetical protein